MLILVTEFETLTTIKGGNNWGVHVVFEVLYLGYVYVQGQHPIRHGMPIMLIRIHDMCGLGDAPGLCATNVKSSLGRGMRMREKEADTQGEKWKVEVGLD